MDFKTSDGIRINYYVYGTGKPVVLIHGFGGYQQIKDYIKKQENAC